MGTIHHGRIVHSLCVSTLFYMEIVHDNIFLFSLLFPDYGLLRKESDFKKQLFNGRFLWIFKLQKDVLLISKNMFDLIQNL